MSIPFTLKHGLKIVRWRTRRLTVSARYGNERLNATPSVLGNAMPKSGSHLIIQVLQGLPRLGPFVNPGFPPVNRSEENRKLGRVAILNNIQRMLPGDIAYGYVGAEADYVRVLTQPGRAMVFVYRDPRDMVVSHVFYATDMNKEHGMHHYYTETLKTMEERINAAIQGVDAPGSELSSVKQRWDHYRGWLITADVLCLRFEDLILEREAALGQILDYLGERGFSPQPERSQAVQVLSQAILPRKSGTFRKGKPGNWKDHFSEANKRLFKEQTGSLLVDLGYEKDENW
jgi:sulfotransferase 6B1